MAGICYIIKRIDNPNLAGVLWSFPLSLLPILIIPWLFENVKAIEIGKLALSAGFSLINMAVFIFSFVCGLKIFEKKSYSVIIALIIGILTWATSAIILYKINITRYYK